MVKKIGFVITLAMVIFLASGSGDAQSKAAEKEADPVNEEKYETVTVNIDDLQSAEGIDIIGYKDESYYNRMANPSYSHNTVLISVDEEVLNDEKVEAICKKYDLSILYDYENFNMYALSSEKTLSDMELAKLIDDLSLEEGVLTVERDYICTIDDGMSFNPDLGILN